MRAHRKPTDADALSLAHRLNELAATMDELYAHYQRAAGHAKEPPVTVIGVNEGGFPKGSAVERAYEDDHNRAVERGQEAP